AIVQRAGSICRLGRSRQVAEARRARFINHPRSTESHRQGAEMAGPATAPRWSLAAAKRVTVETQEGNEPIVGPARIDERAAFRKAPNRGLAGGIAKAVDWKISRIKQRINGAHSVDAVVRVTLACRFAEQINALK